MVRKEYYARILVFLLLAVYSVLAVRDINENINTFYGEADSYMLPTISLLNHGTMIITEEDIEQAAQDFPELYEIIRARYDAGRMGTTRNGEGVNPYYFCTYSVVCIPLKLLFQFWGLSQTPVFGYTNLLLIAGVCVYLFRKLKASLMQRMLLIGLILANPIYSYIPWQSAEVFIFCLVTVSLIHFLNHEYCRSALALSLAGTLNVTVMFFGFILIFSYFLDLMQKEKQPFFAVIRSRWRKIIAFGCCFLIVFLPFIHNYVYAGQINSTFSMYASEGVLSRVWAYLFDLNFGIFAYYPLLLVAAAIVLVSSIRKRELQPVLLLISMLGVVFCYSLAYHINCGMAGISRYGAWTTPFLLFVCVMYFPYHRAKGIPAWGLFGVTAAATILLVDLSADTEYTQMTVWTQAVLDSFPQLYNPMYSTFYSRVSGTDGGYDFADSMPIVYWSRHDGCMRKVLVSSENAEELLEICSGDEASMEYLREAISVNLEKEGCYYINIPAKYQLYRRNPLDGLSTDETEVVLADSDGVSAGGIVLYETEISIQSDSYYEIEIRYSGVNRFRTTELVCDFYGGASYDFKEQEDSFVIYGQEEGEYLAACVLYSGDISTAEETIRIRILNYAGNDEIEISEIRVTLVETS